MMERLTRGELQVLNDERNALANLDLSNENLSEFYFTVSLFENCNFSNANLSDSDLTGIIFSNCNLTGANFTGADLGGADLSTSTVEGAIGIASKIEEMQEAQRILKLLQQPQNELQMDDWHTCETTHCLAGWSCPHLKDPSAEASRKLPTLAKYFYEYENDKAFQALVRVATGEESIWNGGE